MTKPIEVAIREFNDNLVNLVNGSGLPPFVIAQSLRLVLAEIDALAESNYRQALEAYNSDGEASADV